PLDREHRADDVDDRIDRAHFVEVDLVDRNPMDRGIRLAEPAEHFDRSRLYRLRQSRTPDRGLDVLQRMMRRMAVAMRITSMIVMSTGSGMAVSMFMHPEFGCGH